MKPFAEPPGGVAAPDDTPAHAIAEAVFSSPIFQRACTRAEAERERCLREQIELTGIPAPPFAEERRGARFAEMLSEAVEEVERDAVGNVLGRVGGRSTSSDVRASAPVVVSAHLDTVFPSGTDVRVTRDGELLRGPGISDDGRGLAVLLALARVLRGEGIRLRHPLLLVATVGEEGTGDLRGVRHLFGPDGAAREARAFVSLDGAGLGRIVTKGVGSRRLRIRVVGPGGHSWADRGTPNPVHALADAVARVARDPVAGATLNVGRMQGGISVNAIPEEAWIELDIRALQEEPLSLQEARVDAAVDQAVAAANAASPPPGAALTVQRELLGHRPAGGTSEREPLVRAAVAATRLLTELPELVSASTDANVPMHLGIPAVTVGGGGEAAGAHTLEEWYRDTDGALGVARILLALLVLDEIERDTGAAELP